MFRMWQDTWIWVFQGLPTSYSMINHIWLSIWLITVCVGFCQFCAHANLVRYSKIAAVYTHEPHMPNKFTHEYIHFEVQAWCRVTFDWPSLSVWSGGERVLKIWYRQRRMYVRSGGRSRTGDAHVGCIRCSFSSNLDLFLSFFSKNLVKAGTLNPGISRAVEGFLKIS